MLSRPDYQYKFLLRHFGDVPSGWSVVSLSDIFAERLEPNADLNTYPLYSLTIEKGITPKTKRYERGFLLRDQEQNEYKLVHPNDFVINPMNLRFGAIGYSKATQIVSVSAYYDVVRVGQSNVDIDFLEEFLSSKAMSDIFNRVATGSLLEKRRVHYSEFANLKIFLPPKKEQERIGDIIRCWNARISRTETLIATEVKRKRGLIQQLLTGEKRLEAFAGERWKEVQLSDVFERVTRKNDERNTNVVTVSAQRGFVKQDEFFNKIVASADVSGYFLVRRGEFCYNKSYTNHYAWGATKRLKEFEKAVVTTLYICFRIKDESLHSGEFLDQLFEACLLDRGLARIAHEGGRAHGLLNVTPSDFFSLTIKVPTYSEQNAIAEVLRSADREIKLLTSQLKAFKRQKRGLMQNLLTGQRRVSVTNQPKEELMST